MTKKSHEILIVDDAKSIRLMVQAILAELDSEFEFASDGQQAYEMIEAKQYDLIITDINMPKMSGLELCEKVRKELRFKNLPILVMTNKHDYTTVETVLNTGATDFIPKPINEVELQARVNRVLEQRATEKNLYIAQQAAERANHQKSSFLAVVSHELKTPLNAITGFSSLLLQHNLDDKQQRMLQILVSASAQMKSMIDQLLEYDKIETNEKKIILEEVEPAKILEEYLTLNQPLIEEKGLTISQNVSPYITLNTDRSMLVTLVSNLISNAVKYNKSGGRITIECAKSGKGTELSISDTGIGMSESQVDKVFEPFSRFEQDIEGHGLGMAITKSIIDLLELEVKVSSELENGTCISLVFPTAA